jgi:hypothetical protein
VQRRRSDVIAQQPTIQRHGAHAIAWNLDHVFYYPTQLVYAAPEDYGLTYECIRFASTGNASANELHGWFFPAQGPATGTVVHCHGNAGNITGHFEQVHWLPSAGWNLFCFDYRGYGQSAGRPTRAGTIIDAHAAIDYVKSRDDVDVERVVVLGTSLGGAVAPVVLAERDDVRGLVVDSAFSSYRQEVRWVCKHRWYTWGVAGLVARRLISAGLDPVDAIGRVAPCPVLIIQGTADRIVDPSMAKQLFDAAAEPKELWLIDGLGHTEAFDELPDQARPRVLRFFEKCIST